MNRVTRSYLVKRKISQILPAILLLLLGISAWSVANEIAARKQVETLFRSSDKPLAFTENKGQWDARVKYKAEGRNGLTWFFENDGLSLVVTTPDSTQKPLADPSVGAYGNTPASFGDPLHKGRPQRYPLKSHALKWRFVPSSVGRALLPVNSLSGSLSRARVPDPRITAAIFASDPLSWNSNYFLGNDSSKWAPDCKNYTNLTYKNVWQGVDIVYHEFKNQVKYDLFVAPGADAGQIRWQVEGLSGKLAIDRNEIVLPTSLGNLKETIPGCYQMIGGKRVPVSAEYVLYGTDQYGFTFPQGYDHSKQLYIDPLVYSTYLGGSGDGVDERCRAVCSDSTGGAIVVGYTHSTNYPVSTGAYQTSNVGHLDCLITHLNNSGSSVLFSTYLGGVNDENCYAVCLDSAYSICITGSTYSTDYPTTATALQSTHRYSSDCFITRLNYSGSSLLYSTFFGGNGGDWGTGICSDSSGGIFITGGTASSDLLTTSGAYQRSYNGGNVDCFVVHLDSTSSSLLYSTYLGGNNYDVGNGICRDRSGGVFVAGNTNSSNFPTTNGAYQRTYGGGTNDCFLSHLNSTGSSLLCSTYLGGSSADICDGICLDNSGLAVIAGSTASANFPTTIGAFLRIYSGGTNDGFVAKFNSTGSSLLYSTYLGGNNDDGVYGICSDESGGVIATGYTYSTNFPSSLDALQGSGGGSIDECFISHLNNRGSSLLYSTYFGGSSFDVSYGICPDDSDGVTIVGYTYSSNFPRTSGVFQSTFRGNTEDGFVARFRGIANALTLVPFDSRLIHYVDTLDSIFWTSSYISGPISLQLNRTYPSGTWETIASSTANTGSYAWTVTGPASTTARVRVLSVDNPAIGDTSDANFTIQGTLTLTHPDGEERLIVGSQDIVQWTTSGVAGNILVELNRDYPTGTWETLAASVLNLGEADWTVTAPATANARIRISAVNNPAVLDTSSAPFLILPPPTPDLSWGALLTSTAYDRIAVSPTNGNLYATDQDRHFFRSTTSGASWTQSSITFANPTYGVRCSPTGNIYVGTAGSGVYRSTDQGVTFTQVNNNLADLTTTDFACSPTGSHVYAATYAGLSRSSNSGTNWFTVNDQFIHAVGTASNGNVWIAAGDNSTVQYSANPTANPPTWTTASSGLSDAPVISFAFTTAAIFAGTSDGRIFVTTNEGTSWTPSLQVVGAQFQGAQGFNSGRVYFADYQGTGIFCSTDNGATWTAADANLANLFVFGLARSNDGKLLASHNGGIQRSDQIQDLYLTLTKPNGGETFRIGEQDTIKWASNVGGNVRIELNRNYPSGTWESLFANTANDGQEIWNPTSTTQYATHNRIRITSINTPTFSDTSNADFTVRMDSSGVRRVGYLTTAGNPYGIVQVGNYAFVAAMEAGLRIVNVSNPQNPVEVGFYDTPGTAMKVAVSGNYAYVADYDNGLRIVNIGNPASPVSTGVCALPGNATDVAVSGNYAYVACTANGLRVVDISNPSNPQVVGSYTGTGGAHSINVFGNYAYIYSYVVGSVSCLRILNIGNPTSPQEVGSYTTAGSVGDVAIVGNFAYIVDGFSLRILDITAPSNPQSVGVYTTSNPVPSVAVAGNYAYLTNGSSGFRVINISNPANLFEVGFFDRPETKNIFWVAVSGAYAYVADVNSNLQIYDCSACTPELNLSHPNGSEILRVGTMDTIRWYGNGFTGNVNIELNRNYPSGTWESINNNAPNTGSYLWTVTGTTTNSNNRIRITSLTNAAYCDTSNANFSIVLEQSFPLGNSGLSIDMVWCPPGSFQMGSPTTEIGRDVNEGPLHTVTFSQGFWMGKFEVTQQQWGAVMGNNPSHFSSNDHLPVDSVSWNDIQQFETAIGNLFTLPSEAQWEYACRAGTTTRFFWGDDLDSTQIPLYAWNYYVSNNTSHVIGNNLHNPWGFYDINGNVWEWCEDYSHDSYNNAPTDGSAWISPTSTYHINRGGSWGTYPVYSRSAFRNNSDIPSQTIGFRLVRSAMVLTLSHPNGSETLRYGTVDTIRWSGIGFTGNVCIQLNRNYPTGTWDTLAASADNTGSYHWTVVGTSSTTARMRISSIATPSLADTSDANFTIINPAITVTAPNSVLAKQVGSADTIRWTSQDLGGNVLIQINRSYPSGTWDSLTTQTATAGQFAWTVSTPASTIARIRITSLVYPTISDLSDTNFTIYEGLLFTRPNGGEFLQIGVQDSVKWVAGTVTDSIRIELNRNYPTGSWDSITTLANTGRYLWRAPNPATTTARIRLVSKVTGNVLATSAANFEIYHPLIYPNGGDVLTLNVADTIRWLYHGFTGNVNIQFSRTFPTPWVTATGGSNIPASRGYLAWTPTAPATTTYRIRVVPVGRTDLIDTSDANFTVVPTPQLTLTRPNGSERFLIDRPDTIRWTTTYNGYISIYLYRNGILGEAESITDMDTVRTRDGYFVWTPTGPISNDAFIYIVDGNNGVEDYSNSSFRIVNSLITVTRPNGYEPFVLGLTDTLRWSSVNVTGNVGIDIKRGNGSWDTLRTNLPNTGMFEWRPDGSASSAAWIRIRSVADTSISDVSDTSFTIFYFNWANTYRTRNPNANRQHTWNPVIPYDASTADRPPADVYFPDQSSSNYNPDSLGVHYIRSASDDISVSTVNREWDLTATAANFQNAQLTLRFTTADLPGGISDPTTANPTVMAVHSDDDGLTWIYQPGGMCVVDGAAHNTSGMITYQYFVTSVARLGKWSLTNSGLDPVITMPDSGRQCTIGTVDTIRWYAAINGGTVKIELNRNYPSGSWETIATETPNDGMELWTVSGSPSTNARIRITSYWGNPNTLLATDADTSNVNFTIVSAYTETPQAPQNLSITTSDAHAILSWSPVEYSTLGHALTPDGYRVYTGTSYPTTMTLLKTLAGATTTTWTDSNAVGISPKFYQVRAYLGSSSSAPVLAPVDAVKVRFESLSTDTKSRNVGGRK